MRIGIDIGNVIIGGGGSDTQFFTDDFLLTPEIEWAWENVRALKQEGHELHIISKCGPKTEEKSMKWLYLKSFLEQIPAHRIHFVRKRELKAPMALALQLDIFIDDRQDVLDHMHWTEHKILFTSWEQTSEELDKIFDEVA